MILLTVITYADKILRDNAFKNENDKFEMNIKNDELQQFASF